jgi:hypothetical protein
LAPFHQRKVDRQTVIMGRMVNRLIPAVSGIMQRALRAAAVAAFCLSQPPDAMTALSAPVIGPSGFPTLNRRSILLRRSNAKLPSPGGGQLAPGINGASAPAAG